MHYPSSSFSLWASYPCWWHHHSSGRGRKRSRWSGRAVWMPGPSSLDTSPRSSPESSLPAGRTSGGRGTGKDSGWWRPWWSRSENKYIHVNLMRFICSDNFNRTEECSVYIFKENTFRTPVWDTQHDQIREMKQTRLFTDFNKRLRQRTSL